MLFCCIGLHFNNCLVVVFDDTGKVLYSTALIATTPLRFAFLR